MPNPRVGVGSRARRCDFCESLYLGMGHAFSAIGGAIQFTDLGGELATRRQVEAALAESDPVLFVGGGHGLEYKFTGQDSQVILDASNASVMAGRIVCLHSCLTAQELGPALVGAGALAYCGYDVEWTWIQDVDDADPWDDYYASSFWRAALNYYVKVGRDAWTMERADADTRRAYDSEIDYWYSSSDDYAFECIKWLAHDRNGLVTLGDPLATVGGPGGGAPVTRGVGNAAIGMMMLALGAGVLPFVL